MQELGDWIARLSHVRDPGELAFRMHRVAVPSALSFEGHVVRMADAGQEVYPFGSLPGRLSIVVWADTSKGSPATDQSIAAQLGALFTLATNRRVHVAAGDVRVNMQDTTNQVFIPASHLPDRGLSGPFSGGVPQRFESLLEQVVGLDSGDQVVIGAAINLHYASVLLFDTDLNAAYALAVAGIERLSRAYGDPPTSWEAWEDAPRLDRVFVELRLDDHQQVRLREELLQGRHLRLRQTFVSYVTAVLPTDFWDLELDDFTPNIEMRPTGAAEFTGVSPSDPLPIDRFVPRDKIALRRRLLASYDSRSGFVHEGTRDVGFGSALVQRVVDRANDRGPLDYAGLRAILRALIQGELGRRSVAAELPQIRLVL